MALTAAQRAEITIFCGWSARFHQTDDKLDRAMNAIESYPEYEALLTNALAPIDGSPPGLIACCRDAMAKLRLAMNRKKASSVGSIKLNELELENIRGLGRQYATQMCLLLGVKKRGDVFAETCSTGFASFEGQDDGPGGSNYIGK